MFFMFSLDTNWQWHIWFPQYFYIFVRNKEQHKNMGNGTFYLQNLTESKYKNKSIFRDYFCEDFSLSQKI